MVGLRTAPRLKAPGETEASPLYGRVPRPNALVINMHRPFKAGGICGLNEPDFDSLVLDGRYSGGELSR